jgi:recombination protein RecA
MKFIQAYTKGLKKAGIKVDGAAEPPRYWIPTGNYVLNKIISGDFLRGIPQGRVCGLVGPSGSGKSFLLTNIMREAQAQGFWVLAIDSEKALDKSFVAAIGVDPDSEKYIPIEVSTNTQVTNAVSAFVEEYKQEYGDDPENAPRVLIALDSIDMLLTETEWDNLKKGVIKGDQGQRNKQFKSMLRGFVHKIDGLNISIVVTDQVYANQDKYNGEGDWKIKDAIKYSLSEIILITKLKLRDDSSKESVGIRMRCEGVKTRFTLPFQTISIEVPYNTGMDPYNGLLDVAVGLGIIKKVTSLSYCFTSEPDNKWTKKKLDQHLDRILEECIKLTDSRLYIDESLEEDSGDDEESLRERRITKHLESLAEAQKESD